MKYHVVLIETSGNQEYVFATNKLRENVGASEWTYRAGTKLVLDAVVKGSGQESLWHLDPKELRKNIDDPVRNPPIESGTKQAEVVVSTSGKAILLVRDAKVGRDVVRIVTKEALRHAPGLEVRGVVVGGFDWTIEGIKEALDAAYRELGAFASRRPGRDARFARLPMVGECSTSGLPAEAFDAESMREPERDRTRSQVVRAKRAEAGNGLRRMRKIVNWALSRSLDDLERGIEKLNWLAVIHADGNGIGKIFLQFDRYLVGELTARAYVTQLRKFSLGIEECTEAAFHEALAKMDERRKRRNLSRDDSLPVVPLVLGGDDLTVLCDGSEGLELAHDYLQAFEDETKRREVVSRVAAKAFHDVGRLSSCAGVAIVKPHYPFHAAYELAEALIKSAKVVKEIVQFEGHPGEPIPCSALDFQVLFDASASDLDRIRDRLTVDRDKLKPTHLHARPYVVTPEDDLKQATSDGLAWAKRHGWSRLTAAVKILKAKDDRGRPLVPRGQLHDLRAGLAFGRAEAGARLDLIRHRYSSGLESLTLFFEDGGDCRTHLQDAMEMFGLAPEEGRP